MEEFTLICMKLKSGKEVYLAEGPGKSLKWVIDKTEAIYFETEKEAEECAMNYFKKFNDWYLVNTL